MLQRLEHPSIDYFLVTVVIKLLLLYWIFIHTNQYASPHKIEAMCWIRTAPPFKMGRSSSKKIIFNLQVGYKNIMPWA